MKAARPSSLVGFVLALLLASCGPRAPEHEIVKAEGQQVLLDRSTVADGRVHFYTYPHGAKRVNFLVRTDGKGELHVHLDACYSCYRYRRGFIEQEQEKELLCIACRYTYPLENEIWEYQGACAPIPIHFSLEGDRLVVERRILERAARYF